MTCATATKYDVFLSFRGLDTRRTFISFLYKELVRRNIRTFKDDKDLENGQMISPELKRAIEESRFAVVVFSENYAASSWCLDELVEIMDFQKNKGSITVMPVFYGVDPCHLRRQIGEVAEQFKKHESREDHEKVLSWRQALTNLASISGECSLNWEDDSKLVDVIADKISKELMIVIHRESEIKMTCATATKYDVFLSFRGLDTRRTFISFLYQELVRMNIRTFKDDEELENGQRISPELKQAIEESRFAVVVFSENYAASPWCLDELVKIMGFENKGYITVMPIFYGVEPGHVRWQIGVVAEQFKKHESREDHEKVLSWRQALAAFAQLSGDCSGDDDSKLIDKIDHEIFKKKTIFAKISNGRNLVGIDTHMKELNRLMDLNSNKGVRMVGIWARGGEGRSALAKYVYQDICQQFESHCFLGNVKTISQGRHSAHLHHEFLQNIQRENPNKQTLKNQKVLLVVDDVDKLKQLEALAEDFNGFGPGSVVIITTHDKQLLISYGIKLVYEVEL